MTMSRVATIFIISLLLSNSVQAKTGMYFATGSGTGKLKINRLGLQGAWRNTTQNKRIVNGYWELAYSNLHKDTHLQIYSATLAIRLIPSSLPLYIDLAIGAAYMSKRNFVGRELGSNLLFEDRVGVGVLFGKKRQFDLGYRAMHYSNAYLASKNHGLNAHLFLLGYWLS